MKLNLIFYLCFFYIVTSHAQNTEWDYLPKSYLITCFAEEGDFIWIGDYSGVVKMNKTTGAKTYYNKATCDIPDNTILCMTIDNNGVKWFGTESHGLLRFDDDNWSVFDTINSPLPDLTISKIAIDNKNNIWLGGNTNNFGLVKFDGSNWTLYNSLNSGLPDNLIYSIFVDGNDVWASTTGGLTKFNGIDWDIYNTYNSNISEHSSIAINKDNNSNLWIAHDSGVEKFDGNTFTFFGEENTNMPNGWVTSITIDKNNIIWTGCLNYSDETDYLLGGIMSFDGKSWTIYNSTNSIIKEESIYSIFADSLSNIWMGTMEGNVYRKKNETWWNYNSSQVMIDGILQINSIIFDQKNNAYITNKNELIKYDGKSWISLKNFNDHPFDVTFDKDDILFLRSSDGLVKFDGNKWTDIPGAPISASWYQEKKQVAIDASGDIWIDRYSITTGNDNEWVYHFGLARYNGTSWTYYTHENSNLPDSPVGIIKTDRNNSIWVGTSKGLAKFDGVDWEIFNKSNSNISTNNIDDMVFDNDNNLWIPNGHYGFIKFDGTDFTEYIHPTNNIFSASGKVAIDNDGIVWQFVANFLIGFDGQNWTEFSSLNSPLPENINITSFNIDNYGNLWVGSALGIFRYKKGGVIQSNTMLLALHELPIKVFPNPFNKSFEIDLNQNYKFVEIKLTDIFGRNVYEERYENANSINILRNNLASGVYFYQLKLDNQTYLSGKIIAQ